MSTASFLTRFKILNKLGEGSFSEVLRCKDGKDGKYLAAKRLKKRFDTVQDVFECAEVIAMQKLRDHPNILQMSEFHFDAEFGKLTFLFELMDMSLYDYMRARKKCIPEAKAKHFLYQMLCGLDYLHKNGLFHRDIKPENILIKIPLDQEYSSAKNEIVKIGDLGSIRGVYSQPPYTEYISTRWYRSPECLLTAGYYGPKMDVWASGCVFYEMLTSKPLFAGSNEVDQLAKIHMVLGTPSNRLIAKLKIHKSCNCEYFPRQVGSGLTLLMGNMSSEGQYVLKLMITYDPELRTNIKRLLEHKYFSNFRYRRSSSIGPSLDKPVGDYRGSSNLNMKKTPAKQANTKYFTTPDRASQNDVLNFKKYKASDSTNSLGKASAKKIPKCSISNLKDNKITYELFSNVVKGMQDYQKKTHNQVLHKETKKTLNNDAYRRTTSNIQQTTLNSSHSKPNQQSKSFVIPRLTTKRLEPIPEMTNKNNITIPKAPKILCMDRSSEKNVPKCYGKRKKV